MAENVALHCPKCREVAMQFDPQLDLEQDLTCIGCGARLKANELVTADGKTMLDVAADLVKKAFSGIKGFNPSS